VEQLALDLFVEQAIALDLVVEQAVALEQALELLLELLVQAAQEIVSRI
jgi:DNA-binding winged helix-turn-helix (wHTH) protein